MIIQGFYWLLNLIHFDVALGFGKLVFNTDDIFYAGGFIHQGDKVLLLGWQDF